MLQLYSVSTIYQHHYQLQCYQNNTFLPLQVYTAASTSAADVLHTPLCTNDTSCDLQVQMLLSSIESKLTTSIASMISQALVPLRTFVVDQMNALSNKVRILEEDLRHRLDLLETEVNHNHQNNSPSVISAVPTSNQSFTGQHPSNTNHSFKSTYNAVPAHERKFNHVVYGIQECLHGTNWLNRVSNDLGHVSCAILKVDSSINPESFRDCYRLGKYTRNSKRPCPILAILNRSADVTSVLFKRNSLKGDSIAIKPDVSPLERSNEKILLNQRWTLIQSGINRKSIQIRGSRLYVNDKIHGQVINSEYQIHPTLANHHSSILSPTNTSDTPASNPIRTTILGTNSEFDSAGTP